MGALRLPVVSYALPALVSVGLSRHAKAPSWMLPLRWLREAITDRALEAILKMQPESGGYLEAIPITAFCLIGLKSASRADHPVAKNARRFLIDTQREDGSWPVEVNLSVWNTTRAIDALAAGGLLETALSETERATTRDWILAQQTKSRSVYSDTQPGGWGWNHLPGSVPDVDDTSGAILALRSLGVPAEHPALQTGREWLLRLQNRNGGWPTFCRGWEKLPFDQSAPDLTAHALRAIGPSRETNDRPDFEEGLQQIDGWNYLAKAQRADGCFAPLWFGCEKAQDEMNTAYGTTHVLFADPAAKIRDAAAKWLRGIQNSDGGFGGCSGAPSTAEETGLALRALAQDNSECQRAAQWLIDHQRPDGSWNPAPIGFYFAVLWYYEELYPLVYALGGLGALARVQQKTEATAAV
jgi:squalene-hopene/tetraprenyl-beta-curcumene cyclase